MTKIFPFLNKVVPAVSAFVICCNIALADDYWGLYYRNDYPNAFITRKFLPDEGYWINYTLRDDGFIYLGGVARGYPALLPSFRGSMIVPPVVNGYQMKGINDWAFENTPGITEILIPDTITSIAPNAFYGCPESTRIVIGCQTEPCQTHGELWSHYTEDPNLGVAGRRNTYCMKCMRTVKSEVIPPLDYVYNGGPYTNQLENTYIIYCIYNGYAKLARFQGMGPCIDPETSGRFEIPNTLVHDGHEYPVKVLGDWAFLDCANLTEIVIPKNVKQFFYYTFEGTAPDRIVFKCNTPWITSYGLDYCLAKEILVAPGTKGWDTPIPGNWYGFPIKYDLSEYESARQTLSSTRAANARLSQWDCYLAGLNADDPDDDFRLQITMSEGKPRISYSPDLGKARKYTVLGSNDLRNWEPTGTNASDGHSFFKVKIDLPE